MTDAIIFLVIGLAVGAALGYLAARMMSRSSATGGQDVSQLERTIKTLEQERTTLLGDKMKLEGRIEKSIEQFGEQKIKTEKIETENKELTAKLAAAETQNRQIELRLKETKAEMDDLQQKFTKEFE